MFYIGTGNVSKITNVQNLSQQPKANWLIVQKKENHVLQLLAITINAVFHKQLIFFSLKKGKMNILTKICSSVFGKQGTEDFINFHDFFILVNDVDKHFIIISKVKKNL